ncbi:MAG TPA: N-acetylneuraminate synthase family protein [Saprospiraceae bacterium]|nr:N-acetylneuraminate synthase family protein [Saprospiraceae bacterium]
MLNLQTPIIAEIAQAHDGSLGILHSYIDALAGTGVQIVKFQLHIAEAESSELETFRVPFSYVDKTRKEYWKRMEFSLDRWRGIKSHCEEKGMEFLATPFSIAAVDWLEELQVKRYKVGSGDIGNLLLLDRISQTGKPVILSSGMSDWKELQQAVDLFKSGHTDLSVMQCTTAYPCPPEDTGLGLIPEMKSRFQIPVGYSDHSATIAAGIAAVALGADLLEVHVTFDRRMFGPDSKASLTIDEVRQLCEAVAFVERAREKTKLKEDAQRFQELKTLFGKSLSVNKALIAGHVLQKEDLETKKPAGAGIPAADYRQLIGKKLKRDLQKYEFINWSDLADE